MKVEIAFLIGMALLLFIWATWFRFTRWTARRKYKIENDVSKKTGEGRTNIGRTETRELEPNNDNVVREERELQVSDVDSSGKNSKSPRGIFRKLRR